MTEMTKTAAAACDRLDTFIADGRLIRRSWGGHDATGGETACLLVAMAPETGRAMSAAACPTAVMPAWWAYMTVSIDDSGSAGAWLGLIRRYAALARRWHVMDDAAWRRLDYTCRDIALQEALRYVPPGHSSLPAIEKVRDLLRRAASGGVPKRKEWASASAAVAAAAPASTWQVLEAAEVMCVMPAVEMVSAAVAASAGETTSVVSEVASASAASWSLASAASAASMSAATCDTPVSITEAAGEAAVDRMTTAILDALEAAIRLAEAR